MARPPGYDQRNRDSYERLTGALERVLVVLLSFLTVATLAGAVFLMLQMDGSSRSQGGRYYVAIAALLLLGVIDSQFHKLIERRIPLSLTTTPQERLYRIASLLLMVFSAVVLMALAWLLP